MNIADVNRCQIPVIIMRNDTGDVHRLDAKPNPNWLHGGFHHLHTHPHASKIVPFGCITESNVGLCPGDVTESGGWRPRESGPRSLLGLGLRAGGPSAARLGRKRIHSEAEGVRLVRAGGRGCWEATFLWLKRFKRHSSGCPHREFLLVFLGWHF